MKKMIRAFLALAMMFITVSPAMAFIERGTVNITSEVAELTLEVGQTYELEVEIDPDQDDQMEGCGMSDCPQKCGANCLSKDGNCTCDSTSYETYYATVKTKMSEKDIIEAEYVSGAEDKDAKGNIIKITALKEGETELKLSARLREYLGTSITLVVKVVAEGEGPEDPITARVEDVEEVQETDEYAAPDEAGSCKMEAKDREVKSVDITTENYGEEDQQVHLDLRFCCSADSFDELAAADFSGTLAGEVIDPENISVEVVEGAVRVTIKVMAVKAGILELNYNGEVVAPFAIHAIVSPGMELEVVEQDPDNATVMVRVSELYHIRGIGRVQLIENGKVIPTDDEDHNEFTGVHGHNFLDLDGPAIAEKIVFGMNETHPNGYTFTSEGDTVTVTKDNAEGPVELLLTVQSKAEIEIIGKEAVTEK